MRSLSLDGRAFRPTGGRLDSDEVRFEFREADGRVCARYTGGPVVLGVLVGHRDGDALRARYVQSRMDGTTERGYSLNRVERVDGSEVRIREELALDSRAGQSTTVLEEIDS